MKPFATLSLFLLVPLAGQGLADNLAKATLAEGCQLVGPVTEATENCRALRVALRTEVGECMDRMMAEAAARPDSVAVNTSHTNRARFLICDVAVREKMGLVGY